MEKIKWLYTVSPKGWSDMTREEKKEISSKLATVWTYRRYPTLTLAKKIAAKIKAKTEIEMIVVQVSSSMSPL